MTQLIQIDDLTLVNPDHITSINFTPEKAGFDDESNRTYHRQATLTIGLTETVLETFDRFDGEFLGVAAVTNRLTYYGQDAVNIWKYFQSRATKINEDAQPACSKAILDILVETCSVFDEMLNIYGMNMPAVHFNTIRRNQPRIREILEAHMPKVDLTHPAMIALKNRLTDVSETEKEGEK
jgi:hypothetical protein